MVFVVITLRGGLSFAIEGAEDDAVVSLEVSLFIPNGPVANICGPYVAFRGREELPLLCSAGTVVLGVLDSYFSTQAGRILVAQYSGTRLGYGLLGRVF